MGTWGVYSTGTGPVRLERPDSKRDSSSFPESKSGSPFQHGVEPLDRGDDDLAGRIDRVSTEMLDRELLREGVSRGHIPVLLELVECLSAEVVAVHEEQDPARLRMLDEPIG